MRRKTFVGIALLSAVLAAPAAFAGKSEGSQDLYGVRWYATLDHAVAAATPEKGPSKPIVWFRVLGDLDGLT